MKNSFILLFFLRISISVTWVGLLFEWNGIHLKKLDDEIILLPANKYTTFMQLSILLSFFETSLLISND